MYFKTSLNRTGFGAIPNLNRWSCFVSISKKPKNNQLAQTKETTPVAMENPTAQNRWLSLLGAN